QTDQLDLNAGYGQSSTQLNFVSRRGSNRFHGRIYEDFRNDALNANSYSNNVSHTKRNKIILNDFGGSVGGPILHDKLFFFGTFAMSKQPGSASTSNSVLAADAQQGIPHYGAHQVNVLQLAHSFDPTLPNTINPMVGSQIAL